MKIGIVFGLFFLFMASICYADFVLNSSLKCIEPDIIAYKQCVDEKCGTGYIKPEGCSDSCNAKLKEEQDAFDKCLGKGEVCLKHACQVTLTSDYDGVSADGVSKIKFIIDISDEYADFGIDIKPKEGETLRGKIGQISKKEIEFKPDEADKNKDYLTPQIVDVVGWCVPIQSECDTQKPQKQESIYSFTIEQPPLFFVHGIWSSAEECWPIFMKRAKEDKWSYGYISYPTENISANAGRLSYELKEFIKKINAGKYYNNKKINATKVDIVSHSMGGVVTRTYIQSKMYYGNVRKFIMMGTPNKGAWDPEMLSYPTWGEREKALIQLSPNSAFLNELNNQTPRKGIDYYTIAGTGWSTHVGKYGNNTWRGDGVVPVDSVKISGVPIYCTYDTHAEKIAIIKPGIRWGKAFTGVSLTAYEETYKLAKNLLLKGDYTKVADCDMEYVTPSNPILKRDENYQRVGRLLSPATLHAYDEFGNHIGLDKNGKLENTIGEGAYYLANSSGIEGQAIKIIGNKKIKFVIVGYGPGHIGFEFTGADTNGNIIEKSFENISIDARTQYVFDDSSESLELIKEEIKATKTGYNWYMPLIAMLAIILGVLLLVMKKLKKK